jgi:hypothetical protein
MTPTTFRPRLGRKRLNIPRTRDDAVALSGWAAYQLAKGRMDPKQAKALMDMLREFRAQLDGREQEGKLAAIREATALAKERR